MTGLPKKITGKKQAAGQSSSQTKRRAKPTEKRTGGRPTRATRRMSLQTEKEAMETTKANLKESSDSMDEDKRSSTATEISARRSQKNTPPNIKSISPTRKLTRDRQSSLANALGNPIPINTIENTKSATHEQTQFDIDSPTESTQSPTKPSLKTLKQEIGYSDKTPEYEACKKFLKAISPKSKSRMQEKTEIFDIISPEKSSEKETTELLFVEKIGGNDYTLDNEKK